MKTFTERAKALEHLKKTKVPVFLETKTEKTQDSTIRFQAKRAGILVSMKKIEGQGFEISYQGDVPLSAQNKARSQKRKTNDRYRSSKQIDWNPSNPNDPMLGGMSLREIMVDIIRTGGGSGIFKTQCQKQQIEKIANELNLKCTVQNKSTVCEVYIEEK